ncbi:short chain amide porin [Ectothiorhodosinus mongolicus]|uniref:Short chain amide porin n=2 Tax=Ectothiorhodosinus mongolicus TaxID=233100 RepID=A0A1R3W5K3_9GAMM|nr:short chain amide porin [Ectothiorhodosinus mongolicus]
MKSKNTESRPMLKSRRSRLSAAVIASMSALAMTSAAHAGATINIGPNQSFTIGGGLMATYLSVENGADNGSRSSEFSVDLMRLYTTAQIAEGIFFDFNLEHVDAEKDTRLLDAVARFEFNDWANVRVGRTVLPMTRAGMSGPFFVGAIGLNQYPLTEQWTGRQSFRDDGAVLWGQGALGEAHFKYHLGVFNGGSTPSDSPLMASRLTLNFWDAEPGYFHANTYYGAANILAIGVALQRQSDVIKKTDDSRGNYQAYGVDFLMERVLDDGAVFTIDAAYNDYDLDGGTFDSSGNRSASAAAGSNSAYYIQGSYMFPASNALGRLRPYLRYENVNPDAGSDTEKWSLGLEYVINGHNAKVSGVLGRIDEKDSNEANNFFMLGLQFQI